MLHEDRDLPENCSVHRPTIDRTWMLGEADGGGDVAGCGGGGLIKGGGFNSEDD